MTQEDKELLLKDLCARLPNGVMCYNRETESNFKLCDVEDTDSDYPTFDYGYGELQSILPYLRPMSSMTDEEKIEYNFTKTLSIVDYPTLESYDWLNAHHFDYRGLIERGLALEAPKGMYEKGE